MTFPRARLSDSVISVSRNETTSRTLPCTNVMDSAPIFATVQASRVSPSETTSIVRVLRDRRRATRRSSSMTTPRSWYWPVSIRFGVGAAATTGFGAAFRSRTGGRRDGENRGRSVISANSVSGPGPGMAKVFSVSSSAGGSGMLAPATTPDSTDASGGEMTRCAPNAAAETRSSALAIVLGASRTTRRPLCDDNQTRPSKPSTVSPAPRLPQPAGRLRCRPGSRPG